MEALLCRRSWVQTGFGVLISRQVTRSPGLVLCRGAWAMFAVILLAGCGAARMSKNDFQARAGQSLLVVPRTPAPNRHPTIRVE